MKVEVFSRPVCNTNYTTDINSHTKQSAEHPLIEKYGIQKPDQPKKIMVTKS